MNRRTDVEWKGTFLDYLQLHPELGQELTADHDVIVSDTDLARDLEYVGGLHVLEAGREIVHGASLATWELQKPRGHGGRVIYANRADEISIGALRAQHVGRVVSFSAMVMATSAVKPRKTILFFQCARCGAIHRVEQRGLQKPTEPLECFKEDGGCGRSCGSTKFRPVINEVIVGEKGKSIAAKEIKSFLEDEQWLDVQEPPHTLESDRQPRAMKIRLLGMPLMDVALPGDIVLVHGVLDLEDEANKELSPSTYVDGHHVENLTREALFVNDQDVERVRELASQYRNPLRELLVPAHSPHIYGWDDIKAGLVCQLFGGITEQVGNKLVRGTIHEIIFGDPGTAKSELLKRQTMLIPRAVYVNAVMASTAGLTATTEKGGDDKGWGLSPGPLIVADGSVCAIDEVGKLRETEFSALNESMEQMTVSITKAARHTFRARTSIVAAGNPSDGGRYRPHEDFRTQINIPDSTLSRFDLVYIVQDDPEMDVEIRKRLRPYYGVGDFPDVPQLSTRDFTKYVMVARRLKPKLTLGAIELLEKYHNTLRKGERTTFTVRTLEGLYRLSIAVARTRLSESVLEADAQEAIGIHAAGAWGEVHGGERFDKDGTMSQRERMELMLDVIRKAQKDLGGAVDKNEVITRAKNAGIEVGHITSSLKRLIEDDRVIEPRIGCYKAVDTE